MSEAECWAYLAHLAAAGWYWQARHVPGEGYDVTVGRRGGFAVTAVGHATLAGAVGAAGVGADHYEDARAEGKVGQG